MNNNYSYASRSAERLPFVEHLPQGIWTQPDEQDTERFQGLYKRIPLQARPKNGQSQPLSYIDKTLSMGVQSDSSSLNHKLQNMRDKFFKSLTRNYKPTRSQSRERLSNGNLHSTNQEHSSYNQVDSVVIHHEPNVSPLMKRANFQEQNYQFYGKFDTNPDTQLDKNRLSEDCPRFQNASMFVSRQSEDSMAQPRRSQGRHPHHPKSEVENIYRQQEMQRSRSSNLHERDLAMANERPNNAAAYLPTSMSFRANTQNTQSAASVGSRVMMTENEPPRELEIVPEKSQKMFVLVDNGMSKQSSPLSQGQKLYTSFLRGKLSAMNVGQPVADPFKKKSLRNFLHENKNFAANLFESNEITSHRNRNIKSPPRSPQIYNQHKKKNSKKEQIIENYESNEQDDDGWIPLNSFAQGAQGAQGKRQQTLENNNTDPEKTLPSTRRGTSYGNPDGSGLHMLSQITDRLDPVEQDYMKQTGCLNMVFSLQRILLKRVNHGFQSLKRGKSGKGKSGLKVTFNEKTKVKLESLLKDEKLLVKFSVLSDMNSAIKQAMIRFKTQAFYQLKFSTQTLSSSSSSKDMKIASVLMILQISQAKDRNSKRKTFNSWRLTNTMQKNREIEQLRTKKLVQAFSIEKDKLVHEIMHLRDKLKFHEISNSNSNQGSQNFLKSMPSLTELIHSNSNPHAKIPSNTDQTIRHFTINPINKWPTPTSVMEHNSAAETQACSQPGLDSTSNKFTSREMHQTPQGKQVPAPKKLDPIGEFIRRNPRAQSQVDENGHSGGKGKAYGPPAMVQMERILRESILKFATDNNNTTSLGDVNKEFIRKTSWNNRPSAVMANHGESIFGSRKDSIESMVNCSYLKSPDLSEIMREKPNGGKADVEESFGDIDDNSLVASERGLSYRKDTMN